MLASVLERPDRRNLRFYPDEETEFGERGIGMVTDHPPLKFCVSISGFKPATREYDGLYEPGIRTPVLSVLGRSDEIVKAERSAELGRRCQDLKVVWHDGAHVVPRDEETVGRMVEWIGRRVGDEDRGIRG